MKERERKRGDTANGEDTNAIIQAVLRESYLQANEDLRAYAGKVRHFNGLKKAIHKYLSTLREFKAGVVSAARGRGIDLCRGDKNDPGILAPTSELRTRKRRTLNSNQELGTGNREL